MQRSDHALALCPYICMALRKWLRHCLLSCKQQGWQTLPMGDSQMVAAEWRHGITK